MLHFITSLSKNNIEISEEVFLSNIMPESVEYVRCDYDDGCYGHLTETRRRRRRGSRSCSFIEGCFESIKYCSKVLFF